MNWIGFGIVLFGVLFGSALYIGGARLPIVILGALSVILGFVFYGLLSFYQQYQG